MVSPIRLDAPRGTRLWWVDLQSLPEAARQACLSPAEQAQAARFAFEHLRRRYLAAHVALRELLADCTGLAPQALHFTAGPQGKPLLDNAPHCRFNLTHSDEVALVAVAAEGDAGEIGVDVERLRPMRDAMALAERSFTPSEQAKVAGAAAESRDLVFLRGWTRKEACLKAVGSGLSIAPESFEAGTDPDLRSTRLQDTAGAWHSVQVQSLPERQGYVMALAWREGLAR